MKSNRKQFWIPVAAAVILVIGFSIRLTRESNPAGVNFNLPNIRGIEAAFQTMQTGVPHLVTGGSEWKVNIGGPRRTEAASASDWAGVRQSATWANANSTMADQIIMSLKNSGLLANSGAWQTTTVINGVSYKVKLQIGGACTGCSNITASAYVGNKTFANRFKIWRASDGLDVLELLFDDVSTPNTSNGILLTYRLQPLSQGATSDNPALIVESYISGASPSRKQTYSWGARFWNSGSNASTSSDRGRVVLEEMTLGLQGGGMATGLCVRIAARTISLTTGCGTGAHYYALAYGQKTDSNFETTAKSGVALNTLTTGGTVCGLNVLKFGIFNGGGFVQDNLSSVPTGYPDPSVNGGYPGVTALFNKIDTTGSGAGTYDDFAKTRIDGLNTIDFHPSSEAPGF
ncbi:MAG: hypothetical protein K8S54_15185 [Spirochaetia bacterium]|nr:hypothetical protein [Spirochaetia bacterium]